MAIIKTESNFNANAVSSKGAKGLMQIVDTTFLSISENNGFGFSLNDVFDPYKNVLVGVTYLEYLYSKFGDITLTLCAYNAGEGRVISWLQDTDCSSDGRTLDYIPFEETRSYIQKVFHYKEVFSRL